MTANQEHDQFVTTAVGCVRASAFTGRRGELAARLREHRKRRN